MISITKKFQEKVTENDLPWWLFFILYLIIILKVLTLQGILPGYLFITDIDTILCLNQSFNKTLSTFLHIFIYVLFFMFVPFIGLIETGFKWYYIHCFEKVSIIYFLNYYYYF